VGREQSIVPDLWRNKKFKLEIKQIQPQNATKTGGKGKLKTLAVEPQRKGER
jgi:hypothetical protein